MLALHEASEILGKPLPALGFLVDRCDTCGDYKVVRVRWVMTYAGDGVGAYYGPTPPEYDPATVCHACLEDERRAEEELDAYYAAEAEAEEQARREEWAREEERQVQG